MSYKPWLEPELDGTWKSLTFDKVPKFNVPVPLSTGQHTGTFVTTTASTYVPYTPEQMWTSKNWHKMNDRLYD